MIVKRLVVIALVLIIFIHHNLHNIQLLMNDIKIIKSIQKYLTDDFLQ